MSWAPLAGSDPIPGDPGEVESYADDLVRTADLIRDQVTMLRRLAEPGSWVADSADAFRDQASDLAADIDKAEGRYRAVGSELGRWADVLDEAQRRARAMRDEAQQLQRIVDTTPIPVATAPPEGGPAELTPGQEADLRRREAAEREIDELRGRLDDLVGQTEEQAWEHGRRIRAALDDAVADGWFDKLKAKLSGISDVLKQIATWAGYVALALGVVAAVLALVITAPAWLLFAAAAATFVAMVAGIGLALSENGSWWAPALDFVSLCTFGAGAVLKGAAKAAMANARPIVAQARSASASAASLARSPGALALANRMASGRFVPGVLRTPASWYVGFRGWAADRAGQAAARTVQVLPDTSFAQRVLHGGAGQAGLRAQARQFLDESVDPTVVSESLKTVRMLNASTVSSIVGDVSSLAGTYVKDPGPTTDISRWKTVVGRLLKGFS